MQNFLRRLKRFRKRENLSELKYVAVTEKSLNGRYHHHLVINGGVSIKNLAELWGRGYTQARPLQFNEYGLVGMAKYLVKSPLGKRWSSSKNLKRPTVVQRDGRFSAKKLKEIYNDDKIKDINNLFSELFEKTFNYEFVESKPFFNDRNGGYYLCVKMFKPKPKPKRKNK